MEFAMSKEDWVILTIKHSETGEEQSELVLRVDPDAKLFLGNVLEEGKGEPDFQKGSYVPPAPTVNELMNQHHDMMFFEDEDGIFGMKMDQIVSIVPVERKKDE